MNPLRTALDRTLLLMRDDIEDGVSDDILMHALTSTRIALTADAATLLSPAAQTAFVTLALLCVRSGHAVQLMAPDVELATPQPPLSGATLITALVAADGHIVPAQRFATGQPDGPVDLEICFGASAARCDAHHRLWLSATKWAAHLARVPNASAWPSTLVWPMGAMAAATLGAGEAFKCAMRKLAPFARNPQLFAEFFAATDSLKMTLAPEESLCPTDLGAFDVISAGAISHGCLYALRRIPNVRGAARIVEPDTADVTNLNRYALLLLDDVGVAKADQLARLPLGVALTPHRIRFEHAQSLGVLGRRVLVGVDHIPTRWAVQQASPRTLLIGATSHWSAMMSCHTTSCAGCAHPRDDDAQGLIPTVAFVSFMASLLQTTAFLQSFGTPQADEQVYITLPRPEEVWRTPIVPHPLCPLGHARAA